MGASPHANGGLVMRPLVIGNLEAHAVEVPAPGVVVAESTRSLGTLLRDVYRANPDTFRLFCPDETNSNRLGAVFRELVAAGDRRRRAAARHT